MSKVTTVKNVTDSIIIKAIKADIKAFTETGKTGNTVAETLDSFFNTLNWTLWLGNKSAESCGMSKLEFKMVKDTRAEYKQLWEDAKLKQNFDQRWQYVKTLSKHYVAPAETETVQKSAEQKACEHARGLHRQATEMNNLVLLELAQEACEVLGLETVDNFVE